jgi:hypothetical protein
VVALAYDELFLLELESSTETGRLVLGPSETALHFLAPALGKPTYQISQHYISDQPRQNILEFVL